METTYLVLAHSHPDQLARMLDRLLRGSGCRAVVHVDLTADQRSFTTVITDARVRFVDRRHNIRWGDFGSVRATLAALELAVRRFPADCYVLVSGADYPIRPAEHLRAELTSGAIYMSSHRMPDLAHGKPLSRLQHFSVGAKRRSNRPVMWLNRVLRHLPPRDVANGLEGYAPYGGSQWWAMPHDVAVRVLRFAQEHPRLVGFFSRSLNPDEMFFQTVVAAVAPDVEVRDELTWADWSRPVPPGSPATLVDGEFDRVRAASERYWIARKFDWERSQRVLAEIDEQLLSPPA